MALAHWSKRASFQRDAQGAEPTRDYSHTHSFSAASLPLQVGSIDSTMAVLLVAVARGPAAAGFDSSSVAAAVAAAEEAGVPPLVEAVSAVPALADSKEDSWARVSVRHA